MYKYILKKDLPFDKAGEPIMLTNTRKYPVIEAWAAQEIYGINSCATYHIPKKDLYNWIEKIENEGISVTVPIAFPMTDKFMSGTIDVTISMMDYKLLKDRKFKLEINKE